MKYNKVMIKVHILLDVHKKEDENKLVVRSLPKLSKGSYKWKGQQWPL
jgi:hypothetical protein